MNLLLKTEQGKIINQFSEILTIDLIFSFKAYVLRNEDEPTYDLPLINHIDPFADTYINSTQAEMYIAEFEKLLEYTSDEHLKEYCKIVIHELKNLDRCMFLVFSGD
jgi:hypothetical protein